MNTNRKDSRDPVEKDVRESNTTGAVGGFQTLKAFGNIDKKKRYNE